MTFLLPALLIGLVCFLAATSLAVAARAARELEHHLWLRKTLISGSGMLMIAGSAVVVISSLTKSCPC